MKDQSHHPHGGEGGGQQLPCLHVSLLRGCHSWHVLAGRFLSSSSAKCLHSLETQEICSGKQNNVGLGAGQMSPSIWGKKQENKCFSPHGCCC